MNYLNLVLPTPGENLACDEALLNLSEETGTEFLRIWEPMQYFVVLGRGGCVKDEVNVEACQTAGIPILRRISGGGTVILGSGCLCYSLVLNQIERPGLASIKATNDYVLGRLRAVLAGLTGRSIRQLGSTDLVDGNLKVSGNSQKRCAWSLLFHGTVLLDFDLQLLPIYLTQPERQPEYRERRSHINFVRNLNLPAADVKTALREVWNAVPGDTPDLHSSIAKLVDSRYGKEEWNHAR